MRLPLNVMNKDKLRMFRSSPTKHAATNEGLMICNFLAGYIPYQGLVPGWSSYTDTNESVVLLSLYSWAPRREAITTIFKVFGITRPGKRTWDLPYHRQMLYHCATHYKSSYNNLITCMFSLFHLCKMNSLHFHNDFFSRLTGCMYLGGREVLASRHGEKYSWGKSSFSGKAPTGNLNTAGRLTIQYWF